MIGRLSGQLAFRASDHVMIDVGGVGYLVTCSERTLAALPPQGSPVSLYTDLLVREDLLQLFGFSTMAEKECYRLLLTVQGVGAKAAMAILGTLGADGVGRAIALGDMAAVKAAPGIGPKIAQRVVNELKDKAPSVLSMDIPEAASPVDESVVERPATSVDAPKAAKPKARPRNASAQADAMSALANLGYAPSDAATAVARAAGDLPDPNTEDLIRAALRHLAPKE